jgi:hypothetical protein
MVVDQALKTGKVLNFRVKKLGSYECTNEYGSQGALLWVQWLVEVRPRFIIIRSCHRGVAS